MISEYSYIITQWLQEQRWRIQRRKCTDADYIQNFSNFPRDGIFDAALQYLLSLKIKKHNNNNDNKWSIYAIVKIGSGPMYGSDQQRSEKLMSRRTRSIIIKHIINIHRRPASERQWAIMGLFSGLTKSDGGGKMWMYSNNIHSLHIGAVLTIIHVDTLPHTRRISKRRLRKNNNIWWWTTISDGYSSNSSHCYYYCCTISSFSTTHPTKLGPFPNNNSRMSTLPLYPNHHQNTYPPLLWNMGNGCRIISRILANLLVPLGYWFV